MDGDYNLCKTSACMNLFSMFLIIFEWRFLLLRNSVGGLLDTSSKTHEVADRVVRSNFQQKVNVLKSRFTVTHVCPSGSSKNHCQGCWPLHSPDEICPEEYCLSRSATRSRLLRCQMQWIIITLRIACLKKWASGKQFFSPRPTPSYQAIPLIILLRCNINSEENNVFTYSFTTFA